MTLTPRQTSDRLIARAVWKKKKKKKREREGGRKKKRNINYPDACTRDGFLPFGESLSLASCRRARARVLDDLKMFPSRGGGIDARFARFRYPPFNIVTAERDSSAARCSAVAPTVSGTSLSSTPARMHPLRDWAGWRAHGVVCPRRQCTDLENSSGGWNRTDKTRVRLLLFGCVFVASSFN